MNNYRSLHIFMADYVPNTKHEKRRFILTVGSTNAVRPVSPFTMARRNETIAAAINIFTSRSSNCFSTNFQKGVPVHPKQIKDAAPQYIKVTPTISHHSLLQRQLNLISTSIFKHRFEHPTLESRNSAPRMKK